MRATFWATIKPITRKHNSTDYHLQRWNSSCMWSIRKYCLRCLTSIVCNLARFVIAPHENLSNQVLMLAITRTSGVITHLSISMLWSYLGESRFSWLFNIQIKWTVFWFETKFTQVRWVLYDKVLTLLEKDVIQKYTKIEESRVSHKIWLTSGNLSDVPRHWITSTICSFSGRSLSQTKPMATKREIKTWWSSETSHSYLDATM